MTSTLLITRLLNVYSCFTLLIVLLLLLGEPNFAAHAASVTITGSVYCDQCLDGHRTIWGIPVKDAKVLAECNNSAGQVTWSKEGSTNMLGAYMFTLDGSPNMDGCNVHLLMQEKRTSSPSSSCALLEVSARPLELSWKLFGMSMYTAEGLSFKPSKPMSFCPKAARGGGGRGSGSTGSRKGAGSPKVSLPPLPFTKLSACTAKDWLNPQYRCYWRVWSPSTKVGLWYGPAAAKKYGADMTLEAGLRGSGEVHRVLLREAIAATLNAFNSLPFYYNAVEVDFHFNEALAGSDKDVLKWALNFRRANSGLNGKAKCLLTPCK